MSDDDFLSRWSARKRRVAAEDQDQASPLKSGESEPVAEPDPEETEEETLQRLGLPDPDSLAEGDDFQPFMQAGVPGWLRRKALRRLWRTNPVLANLDGLNDYDDDFNSPELTQKVLATAYKVGRGILRDKIMPEEDEAALEEEEEALEPSEAPAEAPSTVSADLEEKPSEIIPAMAEEDPVDTPRPRRMRFRT